MLLLNTPPPGLPPTLMVLLKLILVLSVNLVLPSPPSPLCTDATSEYTTSWTTTNSDGSVVTNSGVVSQSGTSLTTLTTFAPDATSEYTTTWTTTNSDGSVETNSGVVSQSGSSLTTITTFVPDATSEYTTSWTTTNSDGSVVTNSGVVSQSGTSFTTLLHLNLRLYVGEMIFHVDLQPQQRIRTLQRNI